MKPFCKILYHSVLFFLFLIVDPMFLYPQDTLHSKESFNASQFTYVDTNRIRENLDPIKPLPFPGQLKDNYSQKEKTHDFYKTLKEKAYDKKITRHLYDLLIVQEEVKEEKSMENKRGEKKFLPYKGKIIKSIKIKQLDVFGQTIDDTTKKNVSWIESTGNKLHFKTHQRIILNNLLIKNGQAIDPLLLADNERVLRRLPYIEDCRIVISDNKYNSDSVSVIIITKDRWSKGFDIVVDDIDEGRIELWDRNIFGSGHDNQHHILWNQQEKQNIGYEGIYKIKNIGGSFIDGSFNYIDAFETNSYLLSFQRRYVTPYTKYAGNAVFEKTITKKNILYPDTLIKDVPLNLNYYDVWMGRSFLTSKKHNGHSERSSIIIEGRYIKNKYYDRPLTAPQFLHRYHNRSMYLAALAYSRQGFFKTNLVYSFGRTEDIPYGFLFKVTGGIEDNEYYHRSYSGVDVSAGNYVNNIGYFYGGLYLGGFHYKDNIQQGIAGSKGSFFSRLMVLNRFKFRQFVNANYMKGINRFSDEFIDMNRTRGINGFYSDSLRGTQRLSMHIETVTFSPYYLYGFRFVFFGFADIGWIGSSDVNIFTNKMYAGYGLGFRIRNERLVFKTFQVRFAYYPVVPKGATTHNFMLSGERLLNPNDFYSKGPKIPDFD